MTGFAALLRAEWTKVRTVRGWVSGLAAAALVTVLLGMLTLGGGGSRCGSPGCGPTLGPGGEGVADAFTFVHQPLEGDGSITVRVTSLTGDGGGLQEWAKAGVIIKRDTTQGSAYAAVMITGSHGVRMQDDFTHDTAGSPAAVTSRWLRLVRAGDTLTGYESADGMSWTRVGTAHLSGLPAAVQAGLFVTSPDSTVTQQSFGSAGSFGGPSQATAAFDHVSLQGRTPGSTWSDDEIGRSTGGPAPTPYVGFRRSGGTFTLSGSGDIAPDVAGPDGDTLERSLVGVFGGLIAVIVVATMFITSEYRRGLIRTTLAASPGRGRVLAAKAVVIGSVAFAAGLVGTAGASWIVGGIRHQQGQLVLPVSTLTALRVVVGTAALIAVVAVLALAVGTLLRRGATAVTTVIALAVLPYVLSVAPVLPVGAAQWALRLTPAAGFAIQQSTPQYAQVSAAYTPLTGFFPLAPWAGFAVLCTWTAAALGLALVFLRRRDA
ncbi:MAG: hypothetical protein QOF82_984 [Frankiales bacterium]|nr:hypothetical protein [Frankiales bacterium]